MWNPLKRGQPDRAAAEVASAPERAPAAPLEARVEAQPAGGWRVVVPLWREEVRPERETIVREEVVVRRRHAEDVERHDVPVRREELDVTVTGDVDATQPIR
jgi:stress response protein YsnF